MDRLPARQASVSSIFGAMRLALITPGYASPDEANFAIPALTDTVRALAGRHDVHIFTLRYPHRHDSYDLDGATVHAFGWATRGGLSRVRLVQTAVTAIRREHRRQPFDLLHGLWADEPGFVATTAGRLLGRPAVVSLLGGELVGLRDIGYGGQLSRSNRLLTDRALRSAAVITAGSRYLAQIAAARVPNDRLRVLPLGVDTTLFTPTKSAATANPYATSNTPDTPRPTPHFHVLHVASLSPVKDQATLLRALAIVANAHPEVHLHIVGTGPLKAALLTQSGELDIADRVTFHGEVSHDALPDYYRAADLFVLTSRYESQSLVTLEAAACGCPIVGTAVGVLPELLDAAHVAPTGDATALATAISALIVNPQERGRVASESRARVLSSFGLDRTVAELELLYLGLCAGPR